MHSDNTLLANGRAMVEDWHHDHSTVLLSPQPISHHIGTVASSSRWPPASSWWSTTRRRA